MRKEYDFRNARRGAVIESPGKSRITIFLDDDVIDAFRRRAEAQGTGYQTMINAALRASLSSEAAPVTEATLRKTLRKILREELKAA
jgi:uncharacterized protein (DUF4415 family)